MIIHNEFLMSIIHVGTLSSTGDQRVEVENRNYDKDNKFGRTRLQS